MDLTFLILFSLILGLGAWLFFIWSVKSGHYDDIERPKHRMMDDTDDRTGSTGSSTPGTKEDRTPRRNP